ncbi:hypothetical protein KJ912_02725 [Patescibacteria group bacterium]|nr:hypothetical protein [Patescibacteria group bacterium]
MEQRSGDKQWAMMAQYFSGEEFNTLTLEKKLAEAEKLSASSSESGNRFFIEKLFPSITGNMDMGLVDLTAQMEASRNKEGGVRNLDLTLFLDEKGRIDQEVIRFLKWIATENNSILVFMIPTIGDKKRLKTAAFIVNRVLKLDLFDRVVLSGQTVGNNERRLAEFIGELENLCFSKLAENGCRLDEAAKICQEWMTNVELINVCDYVFKKPGSLLPELGFGITGSAAKSQNLWVFRYLALEKMFPGKKVYTLFSDDDYGNMNVELDAVFHASGILSRETKESLAQKIQKYLSSCQNRMLFTEKIKAIWEKVRGSALLRSGGYRFNASPESIQALEDGSENQKIFPETLLGAISSFKGDSCSPEILSGILQRSLELKKILNECVDRGIHITPSMLVDASFFGKILIQEGIVEATEDAEFAIQAFGHALREFLEKAGQGGRVTRIWQRFISQVWGNELGLDHLTYALHGNMSCFLSLETLLAVGFTVETNDNIMGVLSGGIVSYTDGIYSHFPSGENAVIGDQGMLPRVLSALIKKMVECEGLASIPKLKKILGCREGGGIYFKLPQATQEEKREYPFFNEKMYLPTYHDIECREVDTWEKEKFIEINEGIRHAQGPILFFFDPLAVGNADCVVNELPSNKRIVPVLSTAGTLEEIKAFLNRCEMAGPIAISVEHGGAVLFSKKLVEVFPHVDKAVGEIEKKTGFSAHQDGEFLVLELSRRINLDESKKVLGSFEDLLVEKWVLQKPTIRALMTFRSIFEMTSREVIDRTILTTEEEVKRAKNRQYSIPFIVDIKEKGIDIKEVVQKLAVVYSGSFNFLQGASFWYALHAGVNEKTAGEVLKKIFSDSFIIALATNKQKVSLLQAADVKLLSQKHDGSFSDTWHFPPGTTRINERPGDAINILLRKLFKSYQELLK